MLPRFIGITFFLCLSAPAQAGDAPLYVFDNGTGRGTLSVEEQTELARKTGYAGIFYSGTENIPQLVEAHRKRGLKVPGIYTGMNISDASPGFEPGLPEAIRQLKGTGALIAFTINGKAANGEGDAIAVPVLREVADMAAKAGLKVALYPHYGFHVARVEDALRVREKAGRPNIGIVFNLCHWLRSGDEANMTARLRESLPFTLMVSINGADHEGDWDRLIQTLDRGSFDVRSFVKTLGSLGYKGPIGLQCYNVKGDSEENLKRSMAAWRAF
jgi:sugar phosphate isomerase/epimerase